MVSDKFYLKCNSFQENITETYRNLRTDTHFSDVTLVCEEEQQVQAHRTILAACSPFFSNMLKKNLHPHPMIFMSGVKAEVLVAIVDFIYNGEVKIHKHDLESFLALAQEIRLKGLSKKKGYFQFEKGKQTTDQPLPLRDINEKGSYLREDDIGSVDNIEQKPLSENKETKSKSSNSFIQEHFVPTELYKALEIEIDYADLETVLPFSEKIEVESNSGNTVNFDEKCTQKTDYHLQGAETNEKDFSLPEDENGLLGKTKYTVHGYSELPSNKNVHTLPKLKALDFEEELTISENKIELCETKQKPKYTEDNTKTDIPSFTEKQDVTSPSDLLTPKIFLSPDISKEQLDKRIDELMEKTDADKNIWLCTVCLRNSQGPNAMYSLRRHIETHFEGLSYPCEHCEHRSKSKNALSNHRFTQHKEEANLKRINEKENRELLGDYGKKQVSCKFCPYTCQKFSRLKAHTKRHTEEKNYICSICKMSFARSISLKKHSITHDEDTVDTIDKEYRVLDEKIESMMFIGDTMTPDGRRKATVCKMCGKEGYPSVIKKHMETDHLEVYFPCNICNKVFRSRASLRIHNSRRH